MEPRTEPTHRDRIVALLESNGMARLSELRQTGATAAAVARLARDGTIVRLSRGLYQLPDAPLDAHHALAEASKRVGRGVVCLISALAYHELTDRFPRQVWLAIGGKDWLPRVEQPPVRIVRFPAGQLTQDVETHRIEGVEVRITAPARTVVDCFRYRRVTGLDLALEGLREALRTRKATPSEIHALASAARQWTTIRPYLEALAGNG